MPGIGGVHQVHPHLGILHPPGGTGVLALHPDRDSALLQIARLVDDQRCPSSPRWATTQSRTSSRTAFSSQTARASRCCIPSGERSPACSAIVQQFLRGSSANSPPTTPWPASAGPPWRTG